MVCERRRQNREPTQTGKRNQCTQNSRQEGRPENKVADQDLKHSEKYQSDVPGLSTQVEKHQRQGLQLLHVKPVRVRAASQDDQGCDLKEAAESRNRASHEAEERRQQSEAAPHRLKQLIEETRQRDIARGRGQAECETQPK